MLGPSWGVLGVCWGVLKVWRGVREVEGVAETVERGRKHGMLFFAMVLQRLCSWDWSEWSGWIGWEKVWLQDVMFFAMVLQRFLMGG